MDSGLHCLEPESQSSRFEVEEAPGGRLLRNPGAIDIFLHSAQGTQSGRRSVQIAVSHPYKADAWTAYTTYAFFEWALILLDVGFDAVTALDFEGFELTVRDVQGASRGYVYWLPKYANVGRWLACFSTRSDIQTLQ